MRNLLSVVVVAVMVGSASVALAADLPARAAPVALPQYTWAGGYFGIQGGGGWGTSHHSTAAIPIDFSGDFDVNGGIVGGTGGINWQNGAFVFGIEGDLSKSWIKGSTAGVQIPFCPAGLPGFRSCTTELEWLATGRLRLGYAVDRFLPYVTAGVAYGQLTGSTDLGFNSGGANKVGWTAGGGLEYMFTPNLSGKVEYLYVDLGTAEGLFIRNPGNFPFDVEFRSSIVRVGVNYKFAP